MLQKTDGIVLRTLKYNDAWNIVEIYTELFGRTSFLIPASRSKKTSMKPALLQPLSMLECEADFRPLTRLYKIKEISSRRLFTSIPYNPHKTAMALFLAEFLCSAIREETENRPLFEYLTHSIAWLDEVNEGYSNFHLVFLMRLSRFLGLYPNLENYRKGDYFDMLNAGFTSEQFREHSSYVTPEEASRIIGLMRMNYKTMHLFKMNRTERMRCLTFINDYYRIHLPGFPQLKSLKILQELFD